MSEEIIAVLISTGVAIVISVFAWMKANASSSPATWDDKVVEAIEAIAGGVIERAEVVIDVDDEDRMEDEEFIN